MLKQLLDIMMSIGGFEMQKTSKFYILEEFDLGWVLDLEYGAMLKQLLAL